MLCINDFDYYFNSLFANSFSLLDEAIQYSVLNGGKRLRPKLLIATFNSCLNSNQTELMYRHDLALRAASAIEMIHCASLVHDDLPMFDNASERRGKPSVHAKYGEQVALLAGDVLIAKASEVLVGANKQILPTEILSLIGNINVATNKLCLGQSLEFNKKLTSDEIEYYHSLKTSSLFSFCTMAGGIINGYEELNNLDNLGANIGSIYQLIDDLYDRGFATNLQVDKPLNQDEILGKPNFALVNGLQQTQQKIFSLFADSKKILEVLPNSQPLEDLVAEFVKLVK